MFTFRLVTWFTLLPVVPGDFVPVKKRKNKAFPLPADCVGPWLGGEAGLPALLAGGPSCRATWALPLAHCGCAQSPSLHTKNLETRLCYYLCPGFYSSAACIKGTASSLRPAQLWQAPNILNTEHLAEPGADAALHPGEWAPCAPVPFSIILRPRQGERRWKRLFPYGWRINVLSPNSRNTLLSPFSQGA